MSTNDDEPTVEPVARKRRRQVIPYGSRCDKCGEKGKTRVEDSTVGKYRLGTCHNAKCPFIIETGERWKWHLRIPKQCLLEKEPG